MLIFCFHRSWSIILLLHLFLLFKLLSGNDEFCYKDKCLDPDKSRYLFYDVNPPEGFNLRRDVYMRFAILAHQMQTSYNPKLSNFKLVLPPWSHLFHWSYNKTPEHIPWGLYFDLDSLTLFAPVMEMHEFFNTYPKNPSEIIIDESYTLQHFEDMFETGNFEDRLQIDKCQSSNDITYFYYKNITSKKSYCLSYHGPATKLTALLLNTTAESSTTRVFGNKLYWEARRSMRFNKELEQIAAEFRRKFLNSTDLTDDTVLPENWMQEQPKRNAKGGPYLAVHLRRGDFVTSRPKESPNLDSIAKQISKQLELLNLKTVFIATDGSKEEFNKLTQKLPQYKVLKYVPSPSVREKFRDGGVAILDQIICSHAKHFIGTPESTFTFRIQEEREILGFPSHTTFNSLCKNEKIVVNHLCGILFTNYIKL